MIAVQEKRNTYHSMFERFKQDHAGTDPAWLAEIRKSAISQFIQLGFPTTNHEEWRFTNVGPIASADFKPADADCELPTPDDLSPFQFDLAGGCLLVFVNGRFSPELSALTPLPKGVIVQSLAEAIQDGNAVLKANLARHVDYQDQAFAALNTAFMQDGAFIHVPRSVVVEQPIHLLHVNRPNGQPAVTHPRHLIVAEDNSEVTVVETHAGLADDVYFTNAVTEIVVGENATVDHYKVERESDRAFHMATRQLHQFRSSNAWSHTVSFGGDLVRNNINAVLDGEGCNCTLNGLYVLSGKQHVDNHLRVNHAKPHCNSWEFFKGVLDERAKAVFTGRIVVHEDAQKTDAKQSNMNLLLSEDALVNTNPQLEILADDVKCTHGATIGQIDPEAIFYLRTRGISEEAARSLLIYAFAGESIGQIRLDNLRDQLQSVLSGRLPHGDSLRIGRPYEYNREYAEHVRSTDRRRET